MANGSWASQIWVKFWSHFDIKPLYCGHQSERAPLVVGTRQCRLSIGSWMSWAVGGDGMKRGEDEGRGCGGGGQGVIEFCTSGLGMGVCVRPLCLPMGVGVVGMGWGPCRPRR